MKIADLSTNDKPNWCPGCGNYGILMAMKQALVSLNIPPHNTVVVSGIGCSGKIVHWLKTYGFETLHGRPLPVATGIKLANNRLTVIANGGDGDGYGIGGNHFIHSLRRNPDITYIVHNNMVYSLTTGQTSPTSQKGFKSKSTPFGVIELPVNPLKVGLAMGGSFIARGYAGDLAHLSKIIAAGIKHKGFSLIDVLQPCVVFNKVNTYDFYKKRVYKLEEEGHNVRDVEAAWRKADEWGERIPIGIFYTDDRESYEQDLPQLAKKPLALQELNADVRRELMERYA